MADLVVVGPDQGERLQLYGLELVYKLEAAATGGSLSVVEHVIRPGVLVKPHVHSREDELSIVLDGEIAARVGDRVIRAAAGSYLFKPRDIPHAMWNDGSAPSRVVELIVPGGFERYFREVAPILESSSPASIYHELAASYGIRVVDEWVDELEATYGVKL